VAEMRTYAVSGTEPDEGAVLVFAPTARAAKPMGFRVLRGWFDVQWTEVRVKRLTDSWLHSLAKSDQPHVVEDVTICENCLLWGGELVNGECEDCREEAARRG
jgi:hypothetical protein